MRLVFAGTPTVALPSLHALLASDHDVVAVLTRPDAAAGRGRTTAPSPVAELAEELGMEVLRPRRPGDPEAVDRLAAIAPDCCPVVAYGAILPARVLRIPPQGWVNLHFSVLPAWRGAAPVQHALRAGDTVAGATTFRIVEELDAGPVYGVLTEATRPRDTAGELLDRLAIAGARLLVETLDGIESGELEARPQLVDGVSYAPKITVEDARVDWSAPGRAIDRLVRAMSPEPGAWTMFRDERLKLGPLTPRPDTSGPAPGVLDAGRTAVLVGTGTHAVELGWVQPNGRRSMPAADWARGVRLRPDESFA